MYINVVEWLTPNEVMMKMARVSREWYMITWNAEAIKKVGENAMGGFEGYRKMREAVIKGMVGSGTGEKKKKSVGKKGDGGGIKIRKPGEKEEYGVLELGFKEDEEFKRKILMIVAYTR